jgi:hypothetical protein
MADMKTPNKRKQEATSSYRLGTRFRMGKPIQDVRKG